jgi:hypothetical protein
LVGDRQPNIVVVPYSANEGGSVKQSPLWSNTLPLDKKRENQHTHSRRPSKTPRSLPTGLDFRNNVYLLRPELNGRKANGGSPWVCVLA